MTPFYEKALKLFTRTQQAQILKGLRKYPEPFNPLSWTPDELLNHALEETVDLTHYLVGLKELLDVKDKEIAELKEKLESNRQITKFLSSDKKKPQELPKNVFKPRPSAFEQLNLRIMNGEPVPPYFDPDDQ